MDTYYIIPLDPTGTKELNPGEREVLEALKLAIRRYGNPSLREIAKCAKTAIYHPMIHTYLRKLADKGYVELPPPRRARGIKLL